jgi:pimeloyl-ACP methyl ester carboxylesterase
MRFPSSWIALAALIAAAGARPAAATCSPFGNEPRPMVQNLTATTCAGGQHIGPWVDGDGTQRDACLWAPPSASPANQLPLVVYIHPSLFTADTVPFATNLLEFLGSANLSGDPARPGFILLAPVGRATTHFYPSPDDQGTGWDNWYRQVDPSGGSVRVGTQTFDQNVDAATIDYFIASVIATGAVDVNRVYVTGWSNGSAMAYLYALNRPHVAALAVYSAPDPFRAFDDPCPQTPVTRRPRSNAELRIANPGLPTYHVHNDCDIAGLCPNGELLRSQLVPLGVGFLDGIINTAQLPALTCLAACGTSPDAYMNAADDPLGFTLGSSNHTRWPTLWTQSMLDFFRDHPLGTR